MCFPDPAGRWQHRSTRDFQEPGGAERGGDLGWASPNSLPGGPGWRAGWETVSVGDRQRGAPDAQTQMRKETLRELERWSPDPWGRGEMEMVFGVPFLDLGKGGGTLERISS